MTLHEKLINEQASSVQSSGPPLAVPFGSYPDPARHDPPASGLGVAIYEQGPDSASNLQTRSYQHGRPPGNGAHGNDTSQPISSHSDAVPEAEHDNPRGRPGLDNEPTATVTNDAVAASFGGQEQESEEVAAPEESDWSYLNNDDPSQATIKEQVPLSTGEAFDIIVFPPVQGPANMNQAQTNIWNNDSITQRTAENTLKRMKMLKNATDQDCESIWRATLKYLKTKKSRTPSLNDLPQYRNLVADLRNDLARQVLKQDPDATLARNNLLKGLGLPLGSEFRMRLTTNDKDYWSPKQWETSKSGLATLRKRKTSASYEAGTPLAKKAK